MAHSHRKINNPFIFKKRSLTTRFAGRVSNNRLTDPNEKIIIAIDNVALFLLRFE
jgi:hypothetical protein